MGRPVDRVKGVRLITDYGALDWAMSVLKLQQEEKTKMEKQTS